jgi:hypothetical protein
MRDAKENLAAVGLLHNSADGGDGAADEALLTANHLSQLHDSPQATCHIQHNKLSTTNSAQQTFSAVCQAPTISRSCVIGHIGFAINP